MRIVTELRIPAPSLTMAMIVGLAITTSQARGDLVTYDTFSSWEQAVTSFQTITFAGLAPDNGVIAVPIPPGLTLDGVTFTVDRSVSDANLFVYGNAQPFFHGMLSSQPMDVFTYPGNLKILLPLGTTAVALDLSGGLPEELAFSTGDLIDTTLSADVNGMSFFGVTSSQPFTSLEITMNHVFWINFKTVSFGQAAEVPEPSSWSLLSAAFALIAIWRFRRRNALGRQ